MIAIFFPSYFLLHRRRFTRASNLILCLSNRISPLRVEMLGTDKASSCHDGKASLSLSRSPYKSSIMVQFCFAEIIQRVLSYAMGVDVAALLLISNLVYESDARRWHDREVHGRLYCSSTVCFMLVHSIWADEIRRVRERFGYVSFDARPMQFDRLFGEGRRNRMRRLCLRAALLT